jgi:glycosyltransferase involved in cell wall biosynthesis
MKVVLVVPPDTPITGGNFVSAERLKTGLSRLGIETHVEKFHSRMQGYDVYHAWNAVHVGKRLLEHNIDPQKIVVTWTGTDLWGDWAKNPQPIRRALSPLQHQVVFTPNAKKRLLADAPEWDDIVEVIGPSVDETLFYPADSPHTREWPPLVVIAGGVRPVKRSAWAIDLVETARSRLAYDFQLAVLGPVRDFEEWERVIQASKGKPWVHIVGEIPKDSMREWYQRATIVLNSSRIEGVSNALMEAMSSQALVVATNIHGNRYLIEHGNTGFLFDDTEGLVEAFRFVMENPEQSESIRRNARMRILSRHLPSHEAQAYAAIYRRMAWSLCSRGCGL